MIRCMVFVLVLALPGPGTAEKPKDTSATPAEQYLALVKEAEKAQADFFKALQDAPAEDTIKLWKKSPNFGPKFLAFAEKHPKDPAAVDALVRVATNFMPAGHDPNVTKALDLLLRDHLASEKLSNVCERVGYQMFQEGAEAFLLAVLEKSPRKDVQAEACMALAQLPHQRIRLAAEVKKDPDKAKHVIESYGKEALQVLEKLDTNQQMAASEKYFGRFANKYAGELPPQRVVRLYIMLSFSTDEVSERALRTLLAKDTRKEVQGPIMLSLAKVLSERGSALPDAGTKEGARLFAESERLLEQAAEKYPEVKIESFGAGGTVASQAKKLLFGLRHLTVGKVAPDIEGLDQDGKQFKLSDYRGKVVLLDFWSQH
jgi:AhpC/TSA family